MASVDDCSALLPCYLVFLLAGVKGQGTEVILVNPRIVSSSGGSEVFEEGCLSFPSLYADVVVSAWCHELPCRSVPCCAACSAAPGVGAHGAWACCCPCCR